MGRGSLEDMYRMQAHASWVGVTTYIHQVPQEDHSFWSVFSAIVGGLAYIAAGISLAFVAFLVLIWSD
jgi:hypothetical protein